MKQFLLLLTLVIGTQALAQKCLQLEKSGTLKTTKFYIGDDLTFKLNNNEHRWYTRTIADIDVDNNQIIFFGIGVSQHIDSIAAIRLNRNGTWRYIGAALQVGGINAVLFSAYYSVFQDQPLDWIAMGSGLGSVALGTFLRTLKTKKFVVGKRKRLRLLDLNFGPPMGPQTNPRIPSRT